jgi:hypothetical protein
MLDPAGRLRSCALGLGAVGEDGGQRCLRQEVLFGGEHAHDGDVRAGACCWLPPQGEEVGTRAGAVRVRGSGAEDQYNIAATGDAAGERDEIGRRTVHEDRVRDHPPAGVARQSASDHVPPVAEETFQSGGLAARGDLVAYPP